MRYLLHLVVFETQDSAQSDENFVGLCCTSISLTVLMAEASSELLEPENLYQESECDDSAGFAKTATDEPSANGELLSAGDDNETVYSMDG